MTTTKWHLAHYNPNFNGSLGARPADPPGFAAESRGTNGAAFGNLKLLRVSDARTQRAQVYYNYTRRMASAGLTHVADLLTGYASGETLRWLANPPPSTK